MVLSDRDFPTHVAWGAWPRCSTLSSVTLKKGKEKDGRHALGDTSRVASLDQECQTSFSFLPPTTTLRTVCGQLHVLRPAPWWVAAGAGDGSGSGGSRRACSSPPVGTHESRRCFGNGLIAGSQRTFASRTNRPSGGEVPVGASPPSGGSRRGGAGPAPGAARSRTLQFEDPLIRGRSLDISERSRGGQDIWQPPVLCALNKRVRNGNGAFAITERRRPLEC